MPDEALVTLLKNEGVDAWNKARVTHPTYPNCDIYEEAKWGADLSRADPLRAHLCSAIFLGVDLREADHFL
jgi:hypothetical protein